MIFEIADFDPKLGQIWSQNCNVHNFYEIWHSEQIKHDNYEYIPWSRWSWLKIIDSSEFGPNIKTYSNFYEIWHSEQIEYANYEYNTCH